MAVCRSRACASHVALGKRPQTQLIRWLPTAGRLPIATACATMSRTSLAPEDPGLSLFGDEHVEVRLTGTELAACRLAVDVEEAVRQAAVADARLARLD